MSSVGVYDYRPMSTHHHQQHHHHHHQQQQEQQQQQLTSYDAKPMSKTMQYRKVMKPLLERKRRARINRCLDELKDLMISALAMDEENVTKLEKADILEITVAHLQKLKRQKRLLGSSQVLDADRFRAGYTSCAKEVSKVLASTPGVDVRLGTKLMTHLGYQLNDLDDFAGPSAAPVSPLTVKVGPTSDDDAESGPRDYQMPMTPPSSRGSPSPLNVTENDKVWRPW